MIAYFVLVTAMSPYPEPPSPPTAGPVGWYAPLGDVRDERALRVAPIAQWPREQAGPPAAILDGAGRLQPFGIVLPALPQPAAAAALPRVPDPLDNVDPLRWADPLSPPDAPLVYDPDEPMDLTPPRLPRVGPFRCPGLPADSGLSWRHERVDAFGFDTCRSYRPGEAAAQAPLLDLFASPRPTFRPASREVLAETRIRGRPLRWFRPAGGGRYDRETLFAPRHHDSGPVWRLRIVAKSEQELSDTLRLVSRLSLE